jgi:hypothetical protein
VNLMTNWMTRFRESPSTFRDLPHWSNFNGGYEERFIFVFRSVHLDTGQLRASRLFCCFVVLLLCPVAVG